jgi:hypothetical protein
MNANPVLILAVIIALAVVLTYLFGVALCPCLVVDVDPLTGACKCGHVTDGHDDGGCTERLEIRRYRGILRRRRGEGGAS